MKVGFNTATVEHFDSCLGCLCLCDDCPSGVQYDKLIAATRPQIERNYPRSLPERLYRQLIFPLPYPNRLRPMLALLMVYQIGLAKTAPLVSRLSPRLAAMESFYQKFLDAFRDTLPTVIPAVGEKRYRYDLAVCNGCSSESEYSNRARLNRQWL